MTVTVALTSYQWAWLKQLNVTYYDIHKLPGDVVVALYDDVLRYGPNGHKIVQVSETMKKLGDNKAFQAALTKEFPLKFTPYIFHLNDVKVPRRDDTWRIHPTRVHVPSKGLTRHNKGLQAILKECEALSRSTNDFDIVFRTEVLLSHIGAHMYPDGELERVRVEREARFAELALEYGGQDT